MQYAPTHAHVLVVPILGEHFEVICDPSTIVVGAVLLQRGRQLVFESQ